MASAAAAAPPPAGGPTTSAKTATGLFDGMEYDHRMVTIPEDTASLTEYLQEGFWPQWTNVFSDFGVSVSYFIDGDALLAHCLEDPMVDSAHGGQPLHVIYLVHRFLDLLAQRHATAFTLLFFKSMQCAWKGSKLATRTALIRYIRAVCPEIELRDDIESIWDPEFQLLTQLQQPAYLISKREFAEDSEVDPILAEGCKAFILESVNSNQSAVLLDRHTVFEGPRIHAWCLLERPTDDIATRLLTNSRGAIEAAVTAAVAPVPQKAPIEGLPPRLTAAAAVVSAMVAAGHTKDAIYADVCKAFVAHAALLEYFPPNQRAAVLPAELPATKHLAKLNTFWGAVWDPINAYLSGEPSADPNVEALVSDLWDGRFLTRLIIAATASKSLGLPAQVAEVTEKVLKAVGISGALEPLCRGAAAGDVSSCKAAMEESASAAGSSSTFTDATIPRYPSSWLSEVIPEVASAYGRANETVSNNAAEAVAVEAAATEAASVAKDQPAAKEEDDVADNWDDDDDDDWEAAEDAEEAAPAAAAAPSPAKTQAETADATQSDAQAVQAVVAGAAGHTMPPPVEPWLSINPAMDEQDAYRSALLSKHIEDDRDRCRYLLKRFVNLLRRRQRNRVSEYEVIEFFRGMIEEMRAMVRARTDDEDKLELDCANDLSTEFDKNKFMSMTKLVIRRWQPRFVSSANHMRRKNQLMKFAESLQDRIVRQEVILESSEEDAGGKQTQSLAMMAAETAVRRALTVSEKRHNDLVNVLKKVETATRKGNFADAWEMLDDLLIDRCTKDEIVYAATERAVARMEERAQNRGGGGGGGGKGKSKGKAKGKGKGNDGGEVDPLAALLKEHSRIREAIRNHNVRVVGGEARLRTTYAWWSRTYLPRLDAAKATGDNAVIADAQDAERWSAGKVVAELLQLVELTKKQNTMDSVLLVSLTSMLKQLGFVEAADAMILEFASVELAEKDRGALDAARVLVDREGQALTDFQMASMGPLLLRPKGTVDMRIKYFKPDTWQKQLLDLVDTTEEWRQECRKLIKNRSAKTWWEASERVRTRAKDPLQAQSILIHAPTSSGKTFISFYIMEQVLREPVGGEGCVVFVAPTKALVNQVEADLYARFDKNYKRESKVRFMHGIFTKEVRRNLHNCQVLITIPECLELLFMMARHQKFVKRLRWVIFDEVHCISKAEGATWERLLVTSPAPFAALSATIGNPLEFGGWLKDLESAKGRNLNIIEVDQRINDLSLHIYDARDDVPRQREADRAVPLNPLGILSVPLIKSTGRVPKHVKLLPEHCWEIAQECQILCGGIADAELRKMLEKVDLSRRNEIKGLSMMEAADFEATLKDIVWWLVQHDEEKALKLIETFGKTPLEIMTHQDQVSASNPFAYLDQNILPCLKALDSAGAGSDDQGDLKRLPAIVFHLSVRGCNALSQRLTDSLEMEQKAYQCRKLCLTVQRGSRVQCEQLQLLGVESDMIYRIRATGYTEEELAQESEETRRKVEAILQSPSTITMQDVDRFLEVDKTTDWTKDLAPEQTEILEKIDATRVRYYEMVIVKCEQENRKRKKEYDAEVESCRDQAELPPPVEYVTWEHLKPGYIDPQFSFLPAGKGVTDEELRMHLGRYFDRSDFKTKAFQRGIGVHYPELPRKYKNAVERLFRLKKLRVVIATATLALGINMPCKTVIIAGDEPHFNSLDYHQMIGRAGRRTFDNRGNVVFLGTPSRKIIRLISTPVADLVGNVPLTPALALRAFLRHYQGTDREDKERVVRQTQRIVTNMLFSMGCKGQVQHQLLFCADFLMGDTLKLLQYDPAKGDVEPGNICSLVALMYYLEPYNFPLIAAMQRGLLEKLLRKFILKPNATDVEHEETDRQRNLALLQVLAHLIRPRCLPERMRGCPDTSKSAVRLQELPQDFQSILSKYNDDVLSKYSGYLRMYAAAESETLGDSNVLPGCQDKPIATVFKSGPMESAAVDSAVGMLQRSTVPVVTRAPFTALSGHGDSFTSLRDLLNSLRGGLYVDRGLVPVFAELDEPVNSWLIDFYLTGDRARLSAENGIPDETTFDLMNEFSHSLRVLRDALKRRLDGLSASGDSVNATAKAGGGDDDDDEDPEDEAEVEITRLTAEASDLEVVLHGITALESSFTSVFKAAFAF